MPNFWPLFIQELVLLGIVGQSRGFLTEAVALHPCRILMVYFKYQRLLKTALKNETRINQSSNCKQSVHIPRGEAQHAVARHRIGQDGSR